jgi:hypothetical protein
MNCTTVLEAPNEASLFHAVRLNPKSATVQIEALPWRFDANADGTDDGDFA